jgi:hypothetical protein
MSEEIEERVEKLVMDTLDMNPMEKGFNPGLMEYNERKFSMAQRFLSDRKKYGAIEKGQRLRAIGMAFSNPELRESYIRATQPEMLPQLENRPKK